MLFTGHESILSKPLTSSEGGAIGPIDTLVCLRSSTMRYSGSNNQGNFASGLSACTSQRMIDGEIQSLPSPVTCKTPNRRESPATGGPRCSPML
ncbi:hypothetical protein CFIMG_007181RA00001 [Ceratocystis fimbriata CBS 114723]|uniref:Uncharacterized protein n=1 Tax=Ceratocystis fimbriata CBS 114723 TaxID=1035309 RepID=A0A2C5XNB2_9PEZI|nr:hypothetical protein CFIMG_007181RA00001 [Ceratocystis fimbriata CBS 114723]